MSGRWTLRPSSSWPLLVVLALACDASPRASTDSADQAASPPTAAPAPETAAAVEPSPAPSKPAAEAPTDAPTEAPDASTAAPAPEPASLLSEKMDRRLRSALRSEHGARVELAAEIVNPTPAGGVEVFALFEFSEFEACVTRAGGGKKARAKCNPTAGDEDPLPGWRKCTERGLVRATFAPPADGVEPGYGGELEIVARKTELAGGCTIDRVVRFELVDVDLDEQLELAYDVVSKSPDIGFRTRAEYDDYSRHAGFYRLDLEPQFETHLSDWHFEMLMGDPPTTVGRLHVRDENDDGRPDLVIETMDHLAAADCNSDGFGWTTVDPNADPDDPCSAESLGGDSTTLLYDATKDEWLAG
jgi:hypothetical protein